MQDRNRGEGAAIRTRLEQATGDLVLIQDANLEFERDVLRDVTWRDGFIALWTLVNYGFVD